MQNSIWTNIAIFCEHLAPVVSPLTTALGNTAVAIDTAERRTKGLEAQIQAFQAVPDISDRYLEEG